MHDCVRDLGLEVCLHACLEIFFLEAQEAKVCDINAPVSSWLLLHALGRTEPITEADLCLVNGAEDSRDPEMAMGQNLNRTPGEHPIQSNH